MKNKYGLTLSVIMMLLISGAAAALLVAQDEATETPAAVTRVPSVDTLTASHGNYRIRVPAWGFVEPSEVIDIRTEIGGRVATVSEKIFSGGRIAAGARLFSIDPRTYEHQLAVARAQHAKALQALRIEEGQQSIAKAEWQLLTQSQWTGERNQALALREPQMKTCRAEVAIAAAQQAQAALDLERTRISAPCSGVFLAEHLAPGQVLESGEAVLRMACTERYHLKAAFPARYDLDLPTTAGTPVQFQIGTTPQRGVIKAMLPQIDPETRQKQALVSFRGERVTLGAYVELELPGKLFRNVVALPREALRADSTVWVLETGALDIREVVVIAQDAHKVIIGGGLNGGEAVICSHLATPLKGMPLRAKQGPDAAAGTGGRS